MKDLMDFCQETKVGPIGKGLFNIYIYLLIDVGKILSLNDLILGYRRVEKFSPTDVEHPGPVKWPNHTQ